MDRYDWSFGSDFYAIVILLLICLFPLLLPKIRRSNIFRDKKTNLYEFLCNHKWITMNSIEVYSKDKFGREIYIHTEKHCKCDKCGIWIKVNL